MTYKSIETIRRVLMAELDRANEMYRMSTNHDLLGEADEWSVRKSAAEEAIYEFDQKYLDDGYRWYCDAGRVMQMLNECCMNPGADITITVRKDDGREETAVLYDHAALVQGLYDALEYFQSEL